MSTYETIPLALAFDQSDLAYCVIRVILDEAGKPCDWEFIYLNDALARLEGMPKEQLLHKRFFTVFPQADTKWFDYYYPAAYENKSFVFKEVSEEIGVYLRIHCFPVAYGCCGCVLEDISELQESMRRELEGDAVIHGLAKGYDTVWLVKAPRMTVHLYRHADKEEAASLAAKATDGMTYAEGIAQYIERYVLPDDRSRVRQETALSTVKRAITQQDVYTVNYRCIAENGFIYDEMSFTSVEDSDSFVLAIRNVNDIVQAQQQQEQALHTALTSARRANAAKTTFLSNMSHDIRTPMNAIMGFTTLALTHIGRQELVKDYLEKIAVSGRHLLSLINDVLDMSRIESGRMQLEEEPCSLSDVLHELHHILTPDLKAKNLSLSIDTVDVFDETVICDKLRVNQILLNLVGNAIKFTPAGGSISIRLTEKTGKDRMTGDYEFRVKDNGIGISSDFMAHLFEPFERERSSTVSGIQGTGLGLAITKNIVDLMNGTINVYSEKGAGSEFVFTLPLKIADVIRVEPVIEALRNAHALVVDDDFNTCDSLTNMLMQLGMRADWCMSGKEAVLRCRQAWQRKDAYRVYLIDWLIPDMNGVEIARRIRREIGDDAPIIVVSAYDWGDIEEEAKAAGITAFVSKPLFLSGIRKCLMNILEPAEQPEQPLAPAAAGSAGKRLLMAEDNELNREITSEILTEAGYLIEQAENGAAALELLKKHGAGYYDLVLMDIQMPVMDGYEATRAIRALQDPALACIPIVAMTADAFEEDKRMAYEAGMNAHIAKPIDLAELLETLQKLSK